MHGSKHQHAANKQHVLDFDSLTLRTMSVLCMSFTWSGGDDWCAMTSFMLRYINRMLHIVHLDGGWGRPIILKTGQPLRSGPDLPPFFSTRSLCRTLAYGGQALQHNDRHRIQSLRRQLHIRGCCRRANPVCHNVIYCKFARIIRCIVNIHLSKHEKRRYSCRRS